MSASQTALKPSASDIASSTHHMSLITPPPTPRPNKDVSPRDFKVRSRHHNRSKAERRVNKNRAKSAEKCAIEKRRNTDPATAALGIDASQTARDRKSSNGQDKTIERESQVELPATCLSPQDSTPSHDNDNYGPLRAAQHEITATRNHLPDKEGRDAYASSQVPIDHIASDHRLHDSEAAHKLELDRLMTLRLQRTQVFSASSNTLERLLATDNFSAILDDHHVSPAMRASYEFLLGMQHEQSELCAKTEELEAQIKKIRSSVWKLTALDYSKLARWEEMLGMTIALSFELLLEEGAFRDSYKKKQGSEEFDLGGLFAQLRRRVGLVIGEYDDKMERLESGLIKE